MRAEQRQSSSTNLDQKQRKLGKRSEDRPPFRARDDQGRGGLFLVLVPPSSHADGCGASLDRPHAEEFMKT